MNEPSSFSQSPVDDCERLAVEEAQAAIDTAEHGAELRERTFVPLPVFPVHHRGWIFYVGIGVSIIDLGVLPVVYFYALYYDTNLSTQDSTYSRFFRGISEIDIAFANRYYLKQYLQLLPVYLDFSALYTSL